MWEPCDAVSRCDGVRQAVAGVEDVVDVAGDAVRGRRRRRGGWCGGGLARRLFGSEASSSGGWGFGW